MNIINIKGGLSKDIFQKLSSIKNMNVDFINIGGDFGISTSYDPEKPDSILYVGSEVSLILSENNQVTEVATKPSSIDYNRISEESILDLKLFKYDKQSVYSSLDVTKRMLLDNRGILRLNIPMNTIIIDIEVYGLYYKNILDSDPDFPEEDTLLDIDLDLLIRFITNQGFFFTCHAKEGNIHLTLFEKEVFFKNFIKMTNQSWGEYSGLSLKGKVE